MAIKDLIPWNRERAVDVSRRGSDPFWSDPFWSLHREMNRLFEDFGRGLDGWPAIGPRGFAPRIDVRETDDEILVTAEMPGLEEKDFELGLTVDIRQQEWAQFLEFIGPPPDASVSVFRFGWIGDYVDAMNFLDLWTCDSGNNSTNYCDPEYDALVTKARQTPDNEERYEIYGQLEDKLLGEDGAVPMAPIYWYTYVQLERESIKETLEVNLLSQTDYSKVVETDGSGDEG